MTTNNHWGTYKNSLVTWYAEFPPRLRQSPAKLLAFADALVELGSREDISRVSVFGPAGVEERRVADVGAELLSLRPELSHVPHVPAVSVSGPGSLYRSKPPYITISLNTDIWFPRVVGINDDAYRFYDNSPLAERHTPRLNRFLAGVRRAAEALDAEWSYDVDNLRYADQVTDSGVLLERSVDANRVAEWGVRVCVASTTDPAELLFELGVPGTVVPFVDAVRVEPPPPGSSELRLVERAGEFSRLEARLVGTNLTRAHLDDRLGPGADVPRVHPGREFWVSYPVDIPGAPYGCTIFAEFVDQPGADTPACAVMIRRDPSRLRPLVGRPTEC
ncbi:hypothetical protein ACTMTJ_40385 [Phytohabitans sp. LJ34]|uniref:hypothetical protein n=1 Tax=Phytohabitans sp. LJ34 TaxID=3452217 RepID=UPI003F8BE89B